MAPIPYPNLLPQRRLILLMVDLDLILLMVDLDLDLILLMVDLDRNLFSYQDQGAVPLVPIIAYHSSQV